MVIDVLLVVVEMAVALRTTLVVVEAVKSYVAVVVVKEVNGGCGGGSYGGLG